MDSEIRDHLTRALAWGDAHVVFEQAVDGISRELRGRRVDSLPHTLWELVEHIRITQADILAFCRPAPYQDRQWPQDYWPAHAAPASDEEWDASISSYLADRRELVELISGERVNVLSVVPNGSDQTYLRELLVVIDHTAYHVGQIILVRRGLGIWPTE